MRTRTRVRGDNINAVFDNYIYKFRVICFVNSKKIANFEAKHINNTIKLNIPWTTDNDTTKMVQTMKYSFLKR